jgi:hypothetical protein
MLETGMRMIEKAIIGVYMICPTLKSVKKLSADAHPK